jgi:phosphoribosylformylglycinamidine cyclo-ligase
MFRAFNMGLGLVLVCAADDSDRVIDLLTEAGEPNAFRIGTVVAGQRSVSYVGAP